MTTQMVTKDRYQVGLKRLADAPAAVTVFEIEGTTPQEVRDAIGAELSRLGLAGSTATVTVFRPDDYDTGICVLVSDDTGVILRGAGEITLP